MTRARRPLLLLASAAFASLAASYAVIGDVGDVGDVDGAAEEIAAAPWSRPQYKNGVFENPGGQPGHGDAPLSVTIPFFLRRIGGTLSRKPVPHPPVVANDGAFVRQNALGSVPTVTWIGHSTFLVQMGHVTFLTDPTWSHTASPIPIGPRRFVEPGLRFEDLPHVDFAVVSHNHYDHMDLGTLRKLADRGTLIFVPRKNAETLRAAGIDHVEELDWWESRTVKDVTIHCVPAQHWCRRGLFDGNEALWSGWVVLSSDRRFLFAGDTGLFDGMKEIRQRLGPFDLAALPIGAYEPSAMMRPAHMNPEEAITAASRLEAARSVAMHFGTFDLTDEPTDEPPRRYRAASRAAGRGEDRDWLLAIGETRHW
jgi:N-acyl-phosphatidylethanolamine-hydrolysing phospholipase D